jgi:hypothetical protein
MSKKDEAFHLFAEGKRPRDAEVKALGLANKTLYNYYQQWKSGHSNEDRNLELDDISELKRKKVTLGLKAQIDELEANQAKLPRRTDILEEYLDAVVEYTGEALDRIETLASCTFSMVTQLYDADSRVHNMESWDEWETYRKANAANGALRTLDPIPDKLRKLKPRR